MGSGKDLGGELHELKEEINSHTVCLPMDLLNLAQHPLALVPLGCHTILQWVDAPEMRSKCEGCKGS